ncbi:hypothetical protein A9W98_18495 [Mycobacterium gordonae]|uniref:DUF4157 domain-containing protein n=2 Tax=Mycobacteriaceae TaxID=1762 RepID=A0A1A6BHE3_MYCGO|nr:hypothetical protein [Mycobacterium sp.]OBS01762.1 hypothetical protein A9W98_18495 [Mycobacterium gordonae]PJE15703.1 MAG: hypothetical protein CK428_04010 [Mycobacterium sp.]
MLAGIFAAELIAAVMLPGHERAAAAVPVVSRSQPVTTMSSAGDRVVRLVNLGGSESDRLLSRVTADLDGAVDAVVGFWGVDWTHEIAVVATGSDEQFQQAAGGGTASQWADIAAVTVAERVDPVARTMVDARIVLAPGATQMSAQALRIVLSHELFHYAARVDTALDAPRWLTEGVADYVARPQTALPADAQTGAQSLPTDDDLDTPGPQRSLAYDRAWWFARFVADTYGPAKLRQLYVAACGVGHVDLATAVDRSLGIDVAGLLPRWQRWTAGRT